MRRTSALILPLLAVWACDSPAEDAAVGLDGPSQPAGMLTLTLAARPAGFSASNSAGNVPLDAVDAIDVTIDAVEVRPASGAPWIGLDVAADGEVQVNLVALDEAEVLIATGELPADEYLAARLFIRDGLLRLSQEVCLGRAAGAGPNRCLAAGEDHPISVPSGDQTGIKTDAHFTVVAGGADEVTLIFDLDATVRNIAWAPGRGEVIVAPVIRAKAGDDAGSG